MEFRPIDWRQTLTAEFGASLQCRHIHLNGKCEGIAIHCGIWNIREGEEENPGRTSSGLFRTNGEPSSLNDLRTKTSTILVDIFVWDSFYDRLLAIIGQRPGTLDGLQFEIQYQRLNVRDDSVSFEVLTFEIQDLRALRNG